MSSLVVFKSESAAILAPDRIREAVRVCEECVVDYDLLLRLEIEEHRLGNVEGIARLGILTRRVFRLKLISWRRLNIVYLTLIARPDAIRCEVFRIRRPTDRRERIVIPFR